MELPIELSRKAYLRFLVASLRRHPVSLLTLAFFLLCLAIMGSGNRKSLKDDYRVISHRFAPAINCMDGRVQLPVIAYVKAHYSVDHVDMITELGPAKASGVNLQAERR